MIPFNRPFISGNELKYIADAVESGKISANGKYTALCHRFFKEVFGFRNCLLTHSCTAALEMSALLLNIKEGDEIIMPSFTYVTTANAYTLFGARVIFCDSKPNHPSIDETKIEALITPQTKAIVPVHYAGMACDMEMILEIADRYGLYVVEDAAQAIGSYYTAKDGKKYLLGSLGHLAVFSFHETKNIMSGEGGMLVINDSSFDKRAETIWNKGTNRAAFEGREVNKYEWMDLGSSYPPSEITAAFLYAQFENYEQIQKIRREIWGKYYEALKCLEEKGVLLPCIPEFSGNNCHIFYLVCIHKNQRDEFLFYLNSLGINAVFHYQPLHKSPYYKQRYHDDQPLSNAERYAECLVRLPLYYGLKDEEINFIVEKIIHFFQ